MHISLSSNALVDFPSFDVLCVDLLRIIIAGASHFKVILSHSNPVGEGART